MLFENLYKESDRVIAQRLLFAGLELAVIFGLGFLCVLVGSADKKPTVYHPPDSERLAFVDKICSEFPKPEQFNFVEKTSLVSSYKIGVKYKYKTDRNFDEISPTFFIWFNSNGWRRAPEDWLTFYKDNYTITIENFDLPNYNYAISCAEREE